ncbi:MAG: hypothetical protein RMK32_05385 [Anaerolineae bacterium]|nr:hypothetical protein [Thermoflexus sp.]MDW8065046.1 hypothetical protein [Anaerolineae bacterium]
MFQLPAVVTRQAGHGFLWGTALPSHLEELADALRRRGEEIRRVGPVEIVFAFPEWTRPHRIIPRQVLTERGLRIREPWAPFWLIRFGYTEPRADIEGITLEGMTVQLPARDLDLDAVEAYVTAPGWLRCAAGVWVEISSPHEIQLDVAKEEWAVMWLRANLPEQSRHSLEEILREAAPRGISWEVLYRKREARFDLESRYQIEGVLLLAQTLRRYIVKVPNLNMGVEIPEMA